MFPRTDVTSGGWICSPQRGRGGNRSRKEGSRDGLSDALLPELGAVTFTEPPDFPSNVRAKPLPQTKALYGFGPSQTGCQVTAHPELGSEPWQGRLKQQTPNWCHHTGMQPPTTNKKT